MYISDLYSKVPNKLCVLIIMQFFFRQKNKRAGLNNLQNDLNKAKVTNDRSVKGVRVHAGRKPRQEVVYVYVCSSIICCK